MWNFPFISLVLFIALIAVVAIYYIFWRQRRQLFDSYFDILMDYQLSDDKQSFEPPQAKNSVCGSLVFKVSKTGEHSYDHVYITGVTCRHPHLHLSGFNNLALIITGRDSFSNTGSVGFNINRRLLKEKALADYPVMVQGYYMDAHFNKIAFSKQIKTKSDPYSDVVRGQYN